MNELEPHYRMVPPGELPALPRNAVHVVLDNLRSAFNVGSIFRTADAGRVEHLDLCGMTAHPPNVKLQKTALGAFDYVPWSYYETTETAVERLRSQGIPLVAVEVTDHAVGHTAFPWPNPVAIVFGHEVDGIQRAVLQECDHMVCIPMHGHKNSINVATAFGVILYEILRQWDAL